MSEQWRLGDFVDVRGTDMAWKAGRVGQQDPAKGLRVEYVRNEEPFGEWLDSESSRLSRYRTKTKWTNEVELPSISITSVLLLSAKRRLEQEFRSFPSSRSSQEIVTFYRGEVYHLCKNLLQEEPRNHDLLLAGLELLIAVATVACEWLSKVPELYSEILLLHTQAERLYESPQRAFASIWPELLHILSMMLGAGPVYLRFLHVNSR